MKGFAVLFPALLFVAITQGALQQQQPPARPPLPTQPGLDGKTLHGRILPPPGTHGLPLSTTVTLVSGRGSALKTVVPQGNSFQFTVPREGKYMLRVAATAYQTSEVEVVVIDGPTFVSVQLGPPIPTGEDGDRPGSGDTVVPLSVLAIPEEARQELEKANLASEKNDSKRAVRHLERAIEMYPEFAEAYNNLGVQYLRLKKNDEAQSALQRALELEPDIAVAHRNLGLIYLGKQSLAEAQSHLARAHELEPTDFKTANYLAEIYFKTKDYGRALPVFESAYALDPDYHEALLQIGNCHLALRRPADAAVAYETFLERVPDDSRVGQIKGLLKRIKPN